MPTARSVEGELPKRGMDKRRRGGRRSLVADPAVQRAPGRAMLSPANRSLIL
jgi:hypothetical protein